jgi:hypothetical protein
MEGFWTMADQTSEMRIVKAKMYNLKSQVDGLIGMVDNGIITPEQAIEGLLASAVAIAEDLKKGDASG